MQRRLDVLHVAIFEPCGKTTHWNVDISFQRDLLKAVKRELDLLYGGHLLESITLGKDGSNCNTDLLRTKVRTSDVSCANFIRVYLK
jgi:hypothetical protein